MTSVSTGAKVGNSPDTCHNWTAPFLRMFLFIEPKSVQKFFFVFAYGSHLTLLRDYSWLRTQNSLLVVFEGHVGPRDQTWIGYLQGYIQVPYMLYSTFWPQNVPKFSLENQESKRVLRVVGNTFRISLIID